MDEMFGRIIEKYYIEKRLSYFNIERTTSFSLARSFVRFFPSLIYYSHIFKKLKQMFLHSFYHTPLYRSEYLSTLSFLNYIVNSDNFKLKNFISLFSDISSRKKFFSFISYYITASFSSNFISQRFYEKELYSKIKREENFWKFEKWRFPTKDLLPEVFLFHHGFKFLNQRIVERIRSKDIIDLGASLGDSACVFSEYQPNKIYSFEVDDKMFNLLEKTIQINNLSDMVVPVHQAVWKKTGTVSFDGFPRDIFFYHKPKPNYKMNCVSIDDFFEDKDANIGLIKMDIEGFEYEALLGARKTIKKYKPLIIASVYHTGKDFFSIPLLLRSYNPDYKFKFLMLNDERPHKEATLIAF